MNSIFKITFYQTVLLFAGNENVCDLCGKVYKLWNSLYKHRKYECGKEATIKCPQPNCTYKGKTKGHVKSHIAIRHFDMNLI